MVSADSQTRQIKVDESHSCLTIECGKQSKLEFQENHRGEAQMGASQSQMDSGAAGLMLGGMFPYVKLERKTAPHSWQQMVNKSETGVRRQFRSRRI